MSGAPDEAVIIEGKFTIFDAGYRGGFARPPGVEVQGTMRSTSGDLLFEFRYERAGSATMTTDPAADHHAAMTKATRKVARDLAAFMKRWVKGKYE